MHSALGAYEKMKTLQTRVEELDRQAIAKDDEAKSLALKLVKVGGWEGCRARDQGDAAARMGKEGEGGGGVCLSCALDRSTHPSLGGKGACENTLAPPSTQPHTHSLTLSVYRSVSGNPNPLPTPLPRHTTPLCTRPHWRGPLSPTARRSKS